MSLLVLALTGWALAALLLVALLYAHGEREAEDRARVAETSEEDPRPEVGE